MISGITIGSITIILRSVSNANPSGGITASTKALDNAAFGLHPQGYGLANRLAD
jgi:hypothetical protein